VVRGGDAGPGEATPSCLKSPALFPSVSFFSDNNLGKFSTFGKSSPGFYNCRWIEEHQDVILSGPCGTGKSFLVCALDTQACLYGYRVGYYPASKLFGQLKLSRADGSYLKELSRIQKQALIILDDFGLQVLDAPSRLSLLEILEDRYGRASSIVVSQLPVSSWHETIGDPTIADAICDRIVHGAHRIELKRESVRKLYTQRKAEQKGRLV